MLKENSELRAEARQALQGKWLMAAVAALIYSAIAGGLSSIPGTRLFHLRFRCSLKNVVIL